MSHRRDLSRQQVVAFSLDFTSLRALDAYRVAFKHPSRSAALRGILGEVAQRPGLRVDLTLLGGGKDGWGDG